jgi:hypothetical protein
MMLSTDLEILDDILNIGPGAGATELSMLESLRRGRDSSQAAALLDGLVRRGALQRRVHAGNGFATIWRGKTTRGIRYVE